MYNGPHNNGTHRADGDLAFDADIEQAGAETNQYGEAAKNIRRGFNQGISDGAG